MSRCVMMWHARVMQRVCSEKKIPSPNQIRRAPLCGSTRRHTARVAGTCVVAADAGCHAMPARQVKSVPATWR